MRLIRQLLSAARQRVEDAAREVRIRSLSAAVVAERQAGRMDMAREAYSAMRDEVLARSRQQRERMGRRFLSAMHPLERERFLADCEERPGQ